MIKKNFLRVSFTMMLVSLTAGQGYAADFNAATTRSPAQILIQNALIKTLSGTKQASIRLVAKDKKNLHEGQVYQAHFARSQFKNRPDGSYDAVDDVIYIQRLLQAGTLSHQTTLKHVDGKPSEFVVIEMTTSVVNRDQDLFSSVHKVNYPVPENSSSDTAYDF